MARLFLSPGQTYSSIGPNVPITDIIGTNANETVYIEANGKAQFDPSFNRGGDHIIIDGNSYDYDGARLGSSLKITSAIGASITLPAGSAGTTVTFNDGSFVLVISDGKIKLGAQEMTNEPGRLDDVGEPNAPAAAALSFAVEVPASNHVDAAPVDVAAIPHPMPFPDFSAANWLGLI